MLTNMKTGERLNFISYHCVHHSKYSQYFRHIFKLKREWFLLFLLLLSLVPVLTGGAGAIFNDSTKTMTDLFFFINNQFSMFFPMVMFILVGSLFYQEYKNKTYINWITYGYAKPKLFLSKIVISFIAGFAFAIVLFILFCALILVLQATGKVTTSASSLLTVAIGFFLQTAIVVFITTCAGAIVITLSRNIIVTSVVGVIYGFVSCFFIGAEMGYIVPGGFAYRVAMYFSECARHGTNLASESLATGIYRQV